jgi:hypothetical protein
MTEAVFVPPPPSPLRDDGEATADDQRRGHHHPTRSRRYYCRRNSVGVTWIFLNFWLLGQAVLLAFLPSVQSGESLFSPLYCYIDIKIGKFYGWLQKENFLWDRRRPLWLLLLLFF